MPNCPEQLDDVESRSDCLMMGIECETPGKNKKWYSRISMRYHMHSFPSSVRNTSSWDVVTPNMAIPMMAFIVIVLCVSQWIAFGAER